MTSTSDKVQQALGYEFKDAKWLTAALTHPSATKNKQAALAYERLEFVGDRVLGLVIAAALYDAFPDYAEGALAKRHAALVRREALAEIAENIGLPSALKLPKADTTTNTTTGRKTILGDALEALIGAVFNDGGFKAAQKTVLHLFKIALANAGTAPADPKTELQEWAQGKKLGTPSYAVISKSGTAHAPEFVIEARVKNQVATGTGSSKQAAEKAAAAELLKLVRP